MPCVQDRKHCILPGGMRLPGEEAQTVSMHPDDYRAHLAWVTASRARDAVLERIHRKSR